MKTLKANPFYAAGIAAFVIWGFIPFPLKALADYPSGLILYFRVAFSVALLVFISVFFRKGNIADTLRAVRVTAPKEKRQFIVFTLLGGLLLATNWLTFIYVVNHIDIQTGSFSYLLCPILTAMLGFLLLKEELRANQWLAIGLSIISCVLIGTGELTSLLFSLMIALSYAFYLITQRILRAYDKIVLLTLQLLLAFALIGPFYTFFKGDATATLDGMFYLKVLLLSGLFTVLPLFLNLFALKELTSGTIGILMYINPIMNFVIAFVYFNEETTLVKAMAYVLIFISVIIYNLNLKKRRKTADGMPVPPTTAATTLK